MSRSKLTGILDSHRRMVAIHKAQSLSHVKRDAVPVTLPAITLLDDSAAAPPRKRKPKPISKREAKRRR